MQRHAFSKSGEGLALFLFNIFRVYQLEILEITLQSHHQLHDRTNISQRLVHPAADEDFVKLPYSFQNCVMHLKKKNFFCHHNFMKNSHSKLSKNEPKNIQ